jgi:hypothetical protein
MPHVRDRIPTKKTLVGLLRLALAFAGEATVGSVNAARGAEGVVAIVR